MNTHKYKMSKSLSDIIRYQLTKGPLIPPSSLKDEFISSQISSDGKKIPSGEKKIPSGE
jgi:hypothetical protein